MNAIQEETVTVLRGLLDLCREGQAGFRAGADCVVDDPELKMLLSSFSLQRSKFAGELQAQQTEMGEEPMGDVMAGEATRPEWADFERGTSRADNFKILVACERYEDRALSEYNKAVAHEIVSPAREIVQRQRQELITSHNTIRALRDSLRPEPMERMKAKGEEAAASAAEVWQDMKTRSKEVRRTTSGYVRRNPLPFLLGALLTGFSIGLVFYALELRNDQIRLEMRRSPWRKMGNALAGWIGYLVGRTESGYRASAEAVRDIAKPSLFSRFSRNPIKRALRKAF